jgi:hypothetical protein
MGGSVSKYVLIEVNSWSLSQDGTLKITYEDPSNLNPYMGTFSFAEDIKEEAIVKLNKTPNEDKLVIKVEVKPGDKRIISMIIGSKLSSKLEESQF